MDDGEELQLLRKYLHKSEMHPLYEYETTSGPRKAFYDQEVPPEENAGWVVNLEQGRDGWERFEYHEEAYWRRLKPNPANQPS